MSVRFNWGLAMAGVYTVFATSTIGVVILAATRHADLVSDDYYERSITFDRDIAAAARGRDSGVTLVLGDAPAPRLTVTFPDAAAPATAGTVTLYRASAAANDRHFPLAVDGSHRATIQLDGLAAGHWTAKIAWTARGQDYYIEKEIVIP
jgi:hypothetical protein